MIFPPSLYKGDKIRIVSPASRIKKEHVQPAVSWLEKKGYSVELGKYSFHEHFQFAGTLEQRLEDFQTALDDPETTVIICSRGGYGVVQLVVKLDFTMFKKHPKWIVGFSDVTVLHNCLHSMGFASIHGVMARSFLNESGNASNNLISLINLLTNKDSSYSNTADSFNINGIAEGELVGGNLSVISSLMGTKFELEMKDKILFIEDINEYLYKIDRIMYQLKLSAKLETVKALIVGEFSDIKDNNTPFGKSVHEIISDAVKEYNFPVCFNFPAGHGIENLALLLGGKYSLNVQEKECKLTKI